MRVGILSLMSLDIVVDESWDRFVDESWDTVVDEG